ncbi:retention module-containing protein [Chromobacterium phragmitis]|nr:retention module-containing protein [Chromobacterium phragmitis]
MATSTQGHILALQGSVKAIGIDGKTRLLKVGDILLPGEQLQLENGAAIDIGRTDGQTIHIDGTRQVTLTEEVLRPQHADATEAAIAPLAPEAQQILAALDNPNPGPNANPFDNLDPAAAGLNDPGGENSGHAFIRIGRISESLSSLSLDSAPVSAAATQSSLAAANATPDSPPFFTNANGAPLGSDLNVTTKEDTPVSGALTASDPDGDPLTFVKGSDPAHGVVVVNPNGSWTYTPGQDYNGNDAFTVTVNDGRGGTATVTVNVGVTPVNDPPVFGGTDHGVVVEDDITQISGTLVVKDPDAGESGFQPQADITVDYGTFHFDSGTGQWTFTLDNAKAQALTNADRFDRAFTVQSLDGTTHTVTVTIQGKDDAAIITGDNGAVTEDKNVSASNTLDYDGKLNIVDPDQGQAVFNAARVDSQSSNLGSLTIDAAGNWHYSVDNAKVQYLGQGDTRTESFTVYSQDGTSHNVVVVVNGVNDPAKIGGAGDIGDGTVKEDTPAQTVASGKLTVVDVDQGQAQLQPSQQVTDYGTFQANADGTWTFTINNGSDKVQALAEGDTVPLQFTVTSKDGSATSVVTIHVLGTNDAAVIGGTDRGTVKEDTPTQTVASGKLTVVDVDQGQAQLQPSQQVTDYGTFQANADGTWTFTINNSSGKVQALAEGDTVPLQFTVTSKDGSATSVVTIHVLGTNDAAVIGGTDRGTVIEDKLVEVGDKLIVKDVDQGQSYFQAQINTAGTYGTFSIDANGNWHYNLNNSDPIVQALNEGESRIESFIVKSIDGTTSTVTVTVVGTNDIPVFSGADHGAVTEDLNVSAANTLGYDGKLNVVDPDQGQSAIDPSRVGSSAGNLGSLTIDAAGNWHYAVDNAKVQYLGQGDTLTEVFTVYSKDGTAHDITVIVNGVNDLSVITGQDQGSVTEDLNVSAAQTLDYAGKLNITDVDQHDKPAFDPTHIDSKAGNLGSLVIDATGNWHYQVNNADVQYLGQGETKLETFTVYGIDGSSHAITVIVNGVNDIPVFTGTDHGAVTEDLNVSPANTLDYTGKLNVVDPDQGQSVFDPSRVGSSAGNLGSLSIDASGNWHYAVDNAKVQYLGQGDTLTEVFTVYSKDGTAHDITVIVNGINDPAVFTGNDHGAVTEDLNVSPANTLDYSGKLNVVDPDQNQSAIDPSRVGSSAGNLGSLTIDAAGNWHYAVDNAKVQYLGQGDTLTEVFTVYSKDGTAHDITVIVNGVNDPAVITGNDHGAVTEDLNVSPANTLDYSGKLNVVDPDQGQSVFDPTRVDNKATNLGIVTIDASGNWHYAVDNAKVQYLGQGDTRTEVFTVYSKDGTAHDITVIVNGVNDIPVFTGTDHGAVTEDLNVSPANTLDYSGKLNVVDPDQNQSAIDPSRVGSSAGNLGSLTIDAAGNWHYAVDNAKVQYLGQGDTLTEVFTVYSKDGTAHDITVIVNGVNDPAVIDTGTGTVKEDTILTAPGTLHITDPDAGQAFFQPQTNTVGTYGTFSINANGNWHYDLNNNDPIVQALNEGESHIETFIVKSVDGTSSTVTVTVVGTNDEAKITPHNPGDDAGQVKEDVTYTAQGKLDVTDVDTGQAFFQTQTNTAGTYGTFSIDANGNWHYNLNNSDLIVQQLYEGETQFETFIIKSVDGTTSTVTVTVIGTNDVPTIIGTVQERVFEDSATIERQLTVSDTDNGESVFQAQNTTVDYGTFTIDSSGKWTFTPSATAQELTNGQTSNLPFTVYTKDGTTCVVTITIIGKDNVATFTGTDTGSLTEDSHVSSTNTLDATGKLTVSDPDKGQAVFNTSRVDSSAGNLGALTIDANGNWHYSIDNAKVQYLGLGDTRNEIFTVHSQDGTAHKITVTINGANDGPGLVGGLAHGLAQSGIIHAAVEDTPVNGLPHAQSATLSTSVSTAASNGHEPSPSIAHDTPHIADGRASHAAPDSHHPAAAEAEAEAGARGSAGIDTFKWTLGEPSAAAKPEPARNGVADHGPRGEKDALDLKDLLPEGGHRAASLDSYLNGHKEGADAAAEARHPSPGAAAAPGPESVELAHAAALSDAQLLKNLLGHGQQHAE